MFGVLKAVVGFYLVNNFLGFLPGIFPGGDSFQMSYHGMTYVGLALLCGVIVFSTKLILEKLSEIEERLILIEKERDLEDMED